MPFPGLCWQLQAGGDKHSPCLQEASSLERAKWIINKQIQKETNDRGCDKCSKWKERKQWRREKKRGRGS